MSNTIYLERANRDVICHCNCDHSLIGSPSQMDCPWCGCGWLFTCMFCKKAFTFARGVEVDFTLQELAFLDYRGKWKEDPSAEDATGWVDAMKIMLKHVKPGEIYVYLDGYYIPADSTGCKFQGWHARHNLHALPQVECRGNASLLEQTIGSPDYWRRNAVEQAKQ